MEIKVNMIKVNENSIYTSIKLYLGLVVQWAPLLDLNKLITLTE